MLPSSEHLLPCPGSAREGFEGPDLGREATLSAPPGVAAPAVARLTAALARLGVATRLAEPGHPAEIVLATGGRGPAQSYRLGVAPGGIEVRGRDAAGLFYGVATLVQWLDQHPRARGGRLAGLRVDDAPDFPVRGVLLDVSRNKVPKLATLRRLVDRLAALKVNQLQLYTEHAFAYRGHSKVWRGWSPLTAADVRALDTYCAERFVELVPNQNSFGHFHRWLVHEPYRRLAECPDGVDHPWAEEREPFSLCPTDPGSLELLADLYAQLLPNFRSRLFNTGLDETLDLGQCRSAAACEERGKVAVYLDFLRRVDALAKRHGRRTLFWADVILEHPDRLAELPEDAIALAWGYEADHSFARDAARLAAAGREFWVCPGTSSWCSLAGRGSNAVANLASAAIHGHQHGATGYLIADWGDHGHLQPPIASEIGFFAGAAFAWNVASAREAAGWPVAEHLDRHTFSASGGGAGRLLAELADVYRHPGAVPKNGSALFYLLTFPGEGLDHPRYRGLDADMLRAVEDRLGDLAGRLSEIEIGRSDRAQLRRELAWIIAALTTACRIGGLRLAGKTRSPALAAEVGTLIEDLRPLWLARHRPGGLARSVGYLDRTRRALLR